MTKKNPKESQPEYQPSKEYALGSEQGKQAAHQTKYPDVIGDLIKSGLDITSVEARSKFCNGYYSAFKYERYLIDQSNKEEINTKLEELKKIEKAKAKTQSQNLSQ